MRYAWNMRARFLSVLLFIALVAPAAGQVDYQPPPDLEPIHRPYDKLLDDNVRDGVVYFHALQVDRGKLDRYVVALSEPSLGSQLPSWDKPRQIAFWINAYNALSLQTAITHYPRTMRQIPGAFDEIKHIVAGKSVTLDQIENTILASYNDPRIFLVLGRSAMSSGRLRSEAFRGPHLEAQLAESTEQFAKDPKYVHIDQFAGTLSVSPILSWREKAFVDAYKDKSMDLPGRTPIELAVVGMIQPYLLPIEREYLKKNTWKLAYLAFDWKLNDRAGIRH
jgi:uncharacterized protein DUF547